MNRHDFYLGELVTEATMDLIQANAQEADHQFTRDHALTGVVRGYSITPVNPASSFEVSISGPGEAYDAEGQRVALSSTVQTDSLNAIQGSLTAGRSRWVAIYADYDEELSDLELDDTSTPVYTTVTESYALRLVQGTEVVSPADDGDRPGYEAGGVLIGEVLLVDGAAGLTTAEIHTDDPADLVSNFEWMFSEGTTGDPMTVRARNLGEFTTAIVTEINGHITNVSMSHPADAITFDGTALTGGETDGIYTTVLTATDVQGAVENLAVEAVLHSAKATNDLHEGDRRFQVGVTGVLSGCFTDLGSLGGDTVVPVEDGSALVGLNTRQARYVRPTGDLDVSFEDDLSDLEATGNCTWGVIEMHTTTGDITHRSDGATAAIGSLPAFPAGAADQIPLMYVYLEDGMGNVSGTDVIDCRPLLRRPTDDERYEFVGGRGGILVENVGATMQPMALRVRSPEGLVLATPHEPSTTNLNTLGNDIWEAGQSWGVVAGDVRIFFYGMRPVYPAGYTSTLAPRQFVTTGDRVPGAMENMILTATITSAPAQTTTGLTGPITTNSTLWPEFTDGIYIGTATFRVGGMIPQTVYGDLVSFSDNPANRTGTLAAPAAAATGNISLGENPPIGGGTSFLAENVAAFTVGFRMDGAVGDDIRLDLSSTTEVYVEHTLHNSDLKISQFEVHGEDVIRYTTPSGIGGDFRVWVSAYRDANLSFR